MNDTRKNPPHGHDMRNGSPYDRGAADAYYGRDRSPHKYPFGSYTGERIELTDPDEVAAYDVGFYGVTAPCASGLIALSSDQIAGVL